jgi:serine/threonine protein kinase
LLAADDTAKVSDFGLAKIDRTPGRGPGWFDPGMTASLLPLDDHLREVREGEARNSTEESPEQAIEQICQDLARPGGQGGRPADLTAVKEFLTRAARQSESHSIARIVPAPDPLTLEGAVMGSPQYMAPEQARGEIHALSPAVDVYAIGAVLYHLLAGRPPFGGGSVAQLLKEVSTQPPALLGPHVDPALAAICGKCLEKEPRRRYASCSALATDLMRYLRHAGALSGGEGNSPSAMSAPPTEPAPIGESPTRSDCRSTKSWWQFWK